jgi:DNA-binding NtrC family response regulator
MMPSCSCGRFPPGRGEIPPRVLVIDDEPLVRWSLAAGLQLAGFDAVAVADESETRRLAALFPLPAVVLLDVSLWKADARQLLEDIRRLSPNCRFLILAVAGQTVALPPWDGVEVIRKPFDLDEVVRLVASAVRCPAHSAKIAV